MFKSSPIFFEYAALLPGSPQGSPMGPSKAIVDGPYNTPRRSWAGDGEPEDNEGNVEKDA